MPSRTILMSLPADVLAEIDTWLVSAHDSWAWQSTCKDVRDAIPPARPPSKRALPPTFMQAVEGPTCGHIIYRLYNREELRRGANLLRILKAGRILRDCDHHDELLHYAKPLYLSEWDTALALVPELCAKHH